MRITEVITEAVDPIEFNTVTESHIEGVSKEEGDNKVITKANIKATMDDLTLLVVAITIIIIAIIKAEEALAVVVPIINHVVGEEAIIEAIIIINTINITCMMTQSVLLFDYHKPSLSELNAHWSIPCI